MRIFYLPLEPYRERYTEMLLNWTRRRLTEAGLTHFVITGSALGERITTGRVLDAHGRSHWALTQTANLVRSLSQREANYRDIIYLDDMFQPGYESLPYIFDQLPEAKRPRVYVRNWAQSMDANDFTHAMRRWMRPYEQMVSETACGVFVASSAQVELHRVAMLDSPCYRVGLPFDMHDVRERAGGRHSILPRGRLRAKRIIYSSRLDAEKQPHFFFDVAEEVKRLLPGVEIAVSTGADHLRSNDPSVAERALGLAERKVLTIYTKQDKASYYGLLKDSRVQFNCALQDWVSFTALEASALGTPTLAPAFLSFPEVFRNDPRRLYVPWSKQDAIDKLVRLVESSDMSEADIAAPAVAHHATLDRIIRVFRGQHPGQF